MVRFDLGTFSAARALRGRGAFAARLLPVLAAAGPLSACTVVQVSDGKGVRTSYYPGLAVVRVAPADSAQLIEVQSLGASAVGNSATLGWSHSRIALVPPGRCQLILWRPRERETNNLKDLLGPGTEICDLEGEGQ